MARPVRRPRSILSPRARGLQQRRPPLLVALGDLMLDVVIAPSRSIERGTDVPGSVTFRRGGSAANVCAAFVHAGGRARLVTSVGSDPWVRRLLAAVRAESVSTAVVRHVGASGRLAVILEQDGERSFVTQRGVADALRASDLRAAWFTDAAALHVPAYSLLAPPIADAAAHAATLARSAGALVSVDLSSRGPLVEHGPSAARARIGAFGPDLLFANRDEAAALLGQRTAASLTRLLDLAPIAVVKDGRSGAQVLWRDRTRDAAGESPHRIEVAAERLRVTDSTGAGDAFAAGFLRVLVEPSAGATRDGVRKAPSRGADGDRLEPLDAARLRRAALAGHRAAARALTRRPPDLELG